MTLGVSMGGKSASSWSGLLYQQPLGVFYSLSSRHPIRGCPKEVGGRASGPTEGFRQGQACGFYCLLPPGSFLAMADVFAMLLEFSHLAICWL